MVYAPLPTTYRVPSEIYVFKGPYVSPSNVQPEPTLLVNVLKALVTALAATTPTVATPVNAVVAVVVGAVDVAKPKNLSELASANA